MRKAFKIVAAVIIAIIVLVIAFVAVAFLDLAAYTATGSQTLAGTSPVKAIVIYDPGLSGAAKGIADKIASDLQASGYTVTLAGIKSSAAANTTGYTFIVVGGPVYGDSFTSSVKDYLNDLKPYHPSVPNGPLFKSEVAVFGSGGGSSTPASVTMLRNSVSALQNNGTLSQAMVVKIGQSENLTARASDFVTGLIRGLP